MEKACKSNIEELKKLVKNMNCLRQSLGIVYWDMCVNMPKVAGESRGNVIGYLSSEYYKMITSVEVKKLIDELENEKELSEFEVAMISDIKDAYNETKKIPEDIYAEFSVDSAKSSMAWEEAKNKSDFSIFEPHLEKMVNYKRQFANFYGYEKHPYDALLNQYEKGMTVEIIDEVFGNLRNSIVDILNRIKSSNVKIDENILKGNYSTEEQIKFNEYLLDLIGYDYKNRGNISTSEHPFTTEFSNKDVRITNHYDESNFSNAMYSAIHEGGHAIYGQQICDELEEYGLQDGASMGIHESQSRFYENIIGRSKAFLSFIYDELKKHFKKFEDIDFAEFYKLMNIAKPSLIRTESDELTYSLHVIIRYEIEKDLIAGKIEVKDLPKIWNDKYYEYLGVRPQNDSEGVLQDVHWSDGEFGYFPSYALGNIYGAQFLNAILKDMPNLYKDIENGNLDDLRMWLKDNIHKYGKLYKPEELLIKVTGEKLNSKYFIEYLNEKFTEIYNL